LIKKLKSKLIYLFLSVTSFAAAYLFNHLLFDKSSTIISGFEQQLHKKEGRLNDEILKLAQQCKTDSYNTLFAKGAVYYKDLFEKEGLVLLIYENDSLKYWSDNSVAVENWRKEVCLDTKMVQLKNGWFEVMTPYPSGYGTRSVIGLLLIKSEYPYQNKYLINSFQKDFDVPEGTQLTINSAAVGHPVKDAKGNYLFSLKYNNSVISNSSLSYISFFLNILGLLFFVLFTKKVSVKLRDKIGSNAEIIVFSLTLILLRFLSIKFLIPRGFYEFDLFSPGIYADASSVWLSSLGDLTINTFLFFFIGFNFIKEFKLNGVLRRLNDYNKTVFSALVFFVFLMVWDIISSVFIGLIKHSNISFEINNILSLNKYSYIALLIIGLQLLFCFLLADKTVQFLKKNEFKNKQYLFVLAISLVCYALLLVLSQKPHYDYMNILFPIVLMVVLLLIRKEENYSLTKIVALVFLFSFYAQYIVDKYTYEKEIGTQKIVAEKIAAEQDPVAEFLFNDIDNKLQNDSILFSYVNGIYKQPAEFDKRLRQIYFSGFWERYDVKISFYDSTCSPLVKSQNFLFDNTLYYDELISKQSVPTSNKHLFFLKNAGGKISYLAKIVLCDSLHAQTKPGTLYVELDAKQNSNEIGFPELLLDKKLSLSDELTNYSYAKYRNGKLINQSGKFPYNNTDVDFAVDSNNFYVEEKEEFNHLLYRPDANNLIVVSKHRQGTEGRITTFSYLFTFFSLLLLLLFFIHQLVRGTLVKNLSLKNRIQLLLVSIVLASLILFGGGTVYYIKQQFKDKNKENISEKTHSVLVDIENKLGNDTALQQSLLEYSTYLLKKSSNIFFTDINLYDTRGNLYASSRSKIFDKGLTSKKMNPEAYLQMHVLGKREFIHDEKIGKLEYLSAYIPFVNNNHQLLGYLNLPYFAKQNELEKEISGFLVALINIYVLLFTLSVVMAVVISNYVTQPLKLIQDKLGKIKLGKHNERIEWHDKDEIGSLVSEYNRMILELSKSAELLARSERELAWREMAKQVAHEIKNPLTPMKLSVQHLQRLKDDNSPDVDQKMKQLTQTLIEQIDSLSSIATEFSNFAKMPKANLEKVDLCHIISTSIALFSESENVTIELICDPANALVLADKEQLMRVFNNLIKNAIQAIPQNKKGKIEINLLQKNDNYLISVKDNGAGISNDITQKIFVPNFTTKTGGMGLGLAMVKNIVESANGKIWFESNVDEGTVFYISLPCYADA
jgi:two-component system, NtrC family, nitrogen regulation sensor histidine kinase NtrY